MKDSRSMLGWVLPDRTLRRLLGALRPYRRSLLWLGAAILGGSALQLAPPYLTKIVIDRFIRFGDLSGLPRLGALYIGALAGAFALQFAQTWLVQTVGQRLMCDLRLQLFRHVQRLDIGFYDRHPVGGSMSRITSDVDALNELFTSGVTTIFSDVVMMCGIVIVLAWMDWRLAGVAMVALPLVAVAVSWFRRKVRASNRAIRMWVGRLNAFLHERIAGMLTVQLCRAEARDLAAFDDLNEGHLHENLRSLFYYRVLYSTIEVVSALTAALLIWIGGGQVLAGAVPLGTLVAFLQYMQRFFRPVGDLAEKFSVVQGVVAPLERIFALLDTPTETIAPARGAPVRGGVIRFEHVTFGYRPEQPVLKDVTFEVAPGQRIGIVGATGAGKSTIPHLLLRFYDVQEGRITIDGVDIRQFALDDLRAQFGLVLQDVQLFAGTIATNVRLGDASIADREVREALDAVHLDGLVRGLPDGIHTAVAERATTLSAGEKQLISFARALVRNPPVLILDEATSSVDTGTEQRIADALRAVMVGRTTIAIAHRLSTIQDMDLILVMHKGQLRESGTHAELLRQRGLYYRLHEVQLARAAEACA